MYTRFLWILFVDQFIEQEYLFSNIRSDITETFQNKIDKKQKQKKKHEKNLLFMKILKEIGFFFVIFIAHALIHFPNGENLLLNKKTI